MEQWHTLMRDILRSGGVRPDRTGVGTKGVFGYTICFDLRMGFPAVTTKRLAFKGVAGEMATFISGSHNLKVFQQNGCPFWDTNGTDPRWTESAGSQFEGDLGRIYGTQWRFWRGINADYGMRSVDQLQSLVHGLLSDPYGRRHIVSAWNPAELDQMCLPPCPLLFQCYVTPGKRQNKLHMMVYQRSCDVFLGLPCDIAGYALLLHLIGAETNMVVGKLRFMLGDAHIYLNHVEAAETVLKRTPHALPKLVMLPDTKLFGFEPQMVALADYECDDAVFAPLNN